MIDENHKLGHVHMMDDSLITMRENYTSAFWFIAVMGLPLPTDVMHGTGNEPYDTDTIAKMSNTVIMKRTVTGMKVMITIGHMAMPTVMIRTVM
eukprot:5897760-Karenia_brevis.AAC.1